MSVATDASDAISLTLVHSRHLPAMSASESPITAETAEIFRRQILTALRERVEQRVNAARLVAAKRLIAHKRATDELKAAEAALVIAKATEKAEEDERKAQFDASAQATSRRFHRGMGTARVFYANERVSDARRSDAFVEYDEALDWLSDAQRELEWLQEHPEVATEREMIRIASGKSD